MNKFKYIDSFCAAEPKLNVFTEAHKNPLFLSSTFMFDSIEEGIEIFQQQPGKHVYTRYGNPGIESVAQKIADLETFPVSSSASGILTSSGMAAIHVAIQSAIQAGDLLITQGNLYGGTTELMEKIIRPAGIEIAVLDLRKLEDLENKLHQNKSRNTCIFLETPANPTLQCIDIAKLCQIAKGYHCTVIVDNTFATPVLQKPLSLGADIVIHSTTKYLHGHGLSTGGVVVMANPEKFHQKAWEIMKLTGCNSNPFDAWLINIGLKTLALRIMHQSTSAQFLAESLQRHSSFRRVCYPGLNNSPDHEVAKNQMSAFGAMLSFEVGNTKEDAMRFCNKLQHSSIAPSLGETDTMVLHPSTMSHLKVNPEIRNYYGIADNLVRMSVGLEHPEDILEDILQAVSHSSVS